MLRVVCYDISNDRTRDHLSRRLLNFGSRIQESVFECLLDDELEIRLIDMLEKTALGDSDKIRVYRVCADCVETVRIYGKGEITRDQDYYVV
jgi:CRISPR-associated protein Cas2